MKKKKSKKFFLISQETKNNTISIQNFMKTIQKNIAIIGAGPVGLVASMYMEKFGLSYALIERN